MHDAKETISLSSPPPPRKIWKWVGFALAGLLIALDLCFVASRTGRETGSVRDLSARFHPVSIDGFACTVKGVGVAFASMDVRKAKMGALTLGGFNVLEMRDLRLTLYEQATASLGVASPETKGTVLPASDSGDAVETLRTALLPNLRFAGVRISGLKVYRVPDGGTADESKPWLVATELRNSGRQLRLSNVVVNETDGPRALGTALLVVKNGYALAYGKNFGERLKIL